MEFNAFQLMKQTHEHECHLLTQQNNEYETRIECENWNESENNTLNRMETQYKTNELIKMKN